MDSCRMNSVLILVFNILASSQAEPDPDQHIHVHLQPEDSKGGQSPKAAGGVLVPEDGKGGEAPKTGGGHLADYGGWTPKKCHPHCMPNCHSWCRPPTTQPPKRCHPHCMPNCHSWCVPPKKTWEAAGSADYGYWPPKPNCQCPCGGSCDSRCPACPSPWTPRPQWKKR